MLHKTIHLKKNYSYYLYTLIYAYLACLKNIPIIHFSYKALLFKCVF